MVSSRIMVRPAIRCSRCLPITETKQRAAATIGARFDSKLLRNSFHYITWLWRTVLDRYFYCQGWNPKPITIIHYNGLVCKVPFTAIHYNK